MFKINVHYDVRTQPTQFQTCLAKLVVFCLYNKSPILQHYLKYVISLTQYSAFSILWPWRLSHTLEADSDENMADLTIYIRDTLQGQLPDADVDAGTKVLVDKSGGVFIYARYAVERLQMQKHVTLAELDDFPDGLARAVQVASRVSFICRECRFQPISNLQ